jgi:hypothetical protein
MGNVPSDVPSGVFAVKDEAGTTSFFLPPSSNEAFDRTKREIAKFYKKPGYDVSLRLPLAPDKWATIASFDQLHEGQTYMVYFDGEYSCIACLISTPHACA